jgi:hypothetical protein
MPLPTTTPASTLTAVAPAGSRLLIGLYTLFAISAGVRALYQVATKFKDAPLAYSLSCVAALVYLVAAFALRSPTQRGWRVAVGVCLFELLGVLSVGTLTLLRPDFFAHATVWSLYGQGYGYVPLLLPVIGLYWLLRPATQRAYKG